MSDGPSTREQMEQLHHEVRLTLWRRMRKPRVPVQLLAVARTFLNDNGVYVNDETSRKALERIYKLYEEQLLSALKRPNPPAALLLEARHFVESKRQTQSHQPLQLPDTGLPFTLN